MKNSQGKFSGSWRKQKQETPHLSALADLNSPQSTFKIGGYVRLSPTGEEREEGSLVSHPQRINQFIALKDAQSGGKWGEVIEWYVDKDLSGKDMNRPAFQRMLEDIKLGRINAVIVTELSRLNRKVRDFCEVWEFFKSHNVKFFSLKENFDTSTPMGELMLIQAMSFAQFERQTIVDRIKKGAKARAERGLANGSVPLGFKLIPHKPNHREVVEDERVIVEMIFRKFLEFKKLEPTVDFLNKEGCHTKEYETKSGMKNGGLRWTISSVHYLLTNRSYIGEREINKKNRGLDQAQLHSEERYCVTEAQWKPLIPRTLFFDVQALLEENKKKGRKYVHQYRLTELPFCEECGEYLIGKSGNGKNGQKYCYYGHKRKMLAQGDRHLKRCPVESIPALQLEEAVISRLSELSRDKKLVNALILASQTETSSRVEHEKSLLYSKEQERRRLQQKHENLIESIAETRDKAVRLDLITRDSQVKEQLLLIENQVALMKEERSRVEENVIDLSRAFEILKIFRKGFENQPASVQSGILKNVVRRLVVRKDMTIVIELFGSVPEVIGKVEMNTATGTSRSPFLTVSKVVRPAGVEPATYSFGNCHSIQLSYGRIGVSATSALTRLPLEIKHLSASLGSNQKSDAFYQEARWILPLRLQFSFSGRDRSSLNPKLE